ncbi:(deoxy)nucleoside triphosphate pyrophosphohydrolase [Flavobacteriaceae bacterium]|nr:(deoxy)nucleoside triphosphate pyrophosphohydrolase [Flavobacteriaceae bacterium]
MIRVVCGIIYKDDKILLTRRKKGKSLEGFWEFPGGKVEKEETDTIALKRELKEELGLEISELNYFSENKHDYNTFSIHLVAYKCKAFDDPNKLVDHDKFEWVMVNEIGDFNLADADRPLLKEL